MKKRNSGWKVIALLMSMAMVLGGCGSSEKEGTVKEAEEASALNASEVQEDEVVQGSEDAQDSGIIIPELTIEQSSIPDSEALEFVKNMKTGWNLGNTLDAYSGSDNAGLASETSWGNPETTREMISAVKEAGFETVRIPITWHNHLERAEGSDEYTVSSEWLDRVQKVVDYAMDNDMYVIINIHHDTAEDVYYPDSAHYEQSEKYIVTVWEMVAERFKDYDEHLIFESMNEPRLVGSSYEWNFQESVQECKDSADCINRLNQAFVDTVRKSGGNNAQRYLMVPGYAASLAGVTTDLYQLPQDSAENKLIVSTHAYTPYSFALQPQSEGGSTDKFNVEGGTGRAEIDSLMSALYQKFVSQGIPVVMGEYGARNKNDNLQDRVNFYAYYIASARAKGISCCVWDNGAFAGNGEMFGILIRQKCIWAYPEVVEAIMKYA
ncbi:MAG: glycoside hydrolase family 5 protein [Bacillota bacterium]|nr:glycoside hydrolase family 5 protein [Bacillota bacterium]